MGNISEEERQDILKRELDDIKSQKKTVEKWLMAEDKKLSQLEEFMGQQITPIRIVVEMYRQSLPKLDDAIKSLENELKQ